jgi:hypothetical protein
MALKSPAHAVSDLLAAQSIGSLLATATAWRITTGRQSEPPDSLITVYDTGGQSSNPAYRINYPTIQIRVRGAKDKYSEAYAKINDIAEFLNGIDPFDSGDNHYSGIIMQGGIIAMGHDKNSRPEFVVNFLCFVEPTAGSSSFMHRDSL